MQAELAGIDDAVDRWRFTRGCALAIISRPAAAALASLALPIGIVLTTVLLTVDTAYLPLRIGLIVMALLISLLYLSGDRATFFAPRTTGSNLAAFVRAGGALALGGLVLGIVLSDRSGDGNVVDRATFGVPIFTVLIALYLAGFMALTSPYLADTRMLAVGTSLGVTAAVVWLAVVLTQPPLPLSSRSAVAVLGVAILAGAAIGAVREGAVRTALCTALVGALSIFVLTHLALAYGPASWVPSDTAALTSAARLSQSRVEAGESYLRVIVIGAIAAVVILGCAFRNRRRAQLPPQRSRIAAPIG
jgi:hypothetical protein